MVYIYKSNIKITFLIDIKFQINLEFVLYLIFQFFF